MSVATQRKLTLDEKLKLVGINNTQYYAMAGADTAINFRVWYEAQEDERQLILDLTSDGVDLREIDDLLCFVGHWSLEDGSVRCQECIDELGEAYLQQYPKIGRTTVDCQDCGHDNKYKHLIKKPVA